jgi:hypothetical protein
MSRVTTRATRLRRRRRRNRALIIVLLVGALVVAGAGAASAFFSANTNIGVTGRADAIPVPLDFAAAPSSTSVHLSWSPPAHVTSYTLTGMLTGTCTANIPAGTNSCDATGLTPSTHYSWTLTTVYNNWHSPQAATSTNTTSGVGPAAKLTFTTQPTTNADIQATGTGTFSVSVAVQDTADNTVTTDNTTTVNLAIDNNAGPGGVLTCTGGLGPVTASGGIASFTGCAITKQGTGYTLTATSVPLYTAPANANAFNIVAGTATTIAATSGSGQSAGVTTAFTDKLVATVTDTNGNPVSGATVTFTAPGSGASATFGAGGCISNSPTTICTANTVANGQASSSTFTAGATSGGPYDIAASAAGTNTVNFSEANMAAAASKLTFTIQPTSGQNIQATGAGSFSVSVAVQDAGGNTITTDTRNVTLGIGNNAGPSGLLTCTNTGGLTVAASSGVADFTGCAITDVGTGYTLTASSSPALTVPANANSFNITA